MWAYVGRLGFLLPDVHFFMAWKTDYEECERCQMKTFCGYIVDEYFRKLQIFTFDEKTKRRQRVTTIKMFPDLKAEERYTEVCRELKKRKIPAPFKPDWLK